MASKKILLVDDSCTARLVNRMVFSQKSNYVLISAIDGKEAVTFLIKVKDCIEDPKKLPLDF